jgi:hypothetical protein
MKAQIALVSVKQSGRNTSAVYCRGMPVEGQDTRVVDATRPRTLWRDEK